jgi:hypothetical protein
MNPNTIPTAIGYALDAFIKGLPPAGLQTPLFGSPNKPYRQVIAQDGTVAGLQLLGPYKPHEIVAAPYPVFPQAGLPHMCSLVIDPARPELVEMMYWMQMAERVLKGYGGLRPGLIANPVAGARLATFILVQVPSYLAAPGCREKLDLSPYALEQEQIAADNAHIFARSDEVQRLVETWKGSNPPPAAPGMTP